MNEYAIQCPKCGRELPEARPCDGNRRTGLGELQTLGCGCAGKWLHDDNGHLLPIHNDDACIVCRDDEIAALRAAIATFDASDLGKALDVVEFYADPENYHAISFLFDRPCGGFADDFDEDHGHPDYNRPMPGKLARGLLRGESMGKDSGVDELKTGGGAVSTGEICKHNSHGLACQICELEATVRTLTESLRETERARDSAKDRAERLYNEVTDDAKIINKLQNEINASTCEKMSLKNELLARQDDIIDLRNALCGILYLADEAESSCAIDRELPTKIANASRRALEKTQ